MLSALAKSGPSTPALDFRKADTVASIVDWRVRVTAALSLERAAYRCNSMSAA
jgi:hypothetical protein